MKSHHKAVKFCSFNSNNCFKKGNAIRKGICVRLVFQFMEFGKKKKALVYVEVTLKTRIVCGDFGLHRIEAIKDTT